MNREDVTELIAVARIKKGLKFAEIAAAVGKSKEWVTAGLMGQMSFDKAQAETIGKLLDLPEDAVALLQVSPYKGSLPESIPTDPLIYRFYEIMAVFGTTFKSLIHEEFGDGIMSAIDFDVSITRQPDPKGDRVRVEMSGKFLPYRTF